METIILNKDNLYKLSEIERSYLQGIINKIGITKEQEQNAYGLLTLCAAEMKKATRTGKLDGNIVVGNKNITDIIMDFLNTLG